MVDPAETGSCSAVSKAVHVLAGMEPAEETTRCLASEYPLTLYVNGSELVTLLCTPFQLEALVTGFLFSGGFIDDVLEIQSMSIEHSKGICKVSVNRDVELQMKAMGKRTLTSGCGKGVAFYDASDLLASCFISSDIVVSRSAIYALARKVQETAKIYPATRGVHCAALAKGEEVIFFSEDIGRHNAVDKLVGQSLINRIVPDDKIVFVSGRLTSEVVTKAIRFGVPILASRSVPSTLGFGFASQLGLTLVGFVRGEKCVVYTHPQRIC